VLGIPNTSIVTLTVSHRVRAQIPKRPVHHTSTPASTRQDPLRTKVTNQSSTALKIITPRRKVEAHQPQPRQFLLEHQSTSLPEFVATTFPGLNQ